MIGNIQPILIALLGPTACGKSRLAIELAETFGLEIVNCDSRQIYRGMEIGTAKPTPSERSRIPHHLIDIIEPNQLFSAGDYLREAKACLESIWKSGRIPLLVGGTGFYFDALQNGLPSFKDGNSDMAFWRSHWTSLFETAGLGALIEELKRRDADAVNQIDVANPRRVIRALEIISATGRPLAESRQRSGAIQARMKIIVGSRQRTELWERIRTRTEAMIAAGLRDEAERLFAAYSDKAPGLRTIGYAEWVPYFAGKIGLDDVKREIVIHTRQYAKRQETWFRKRPGGPFYDFADPKIFDRLRSEVADFIERNARQP